MVTGRVSVVIIIALRQIGAILVIHRLAFARVYGRGQGWVSYFYTEGDIEDLNVFNVV
jgi:hypothetical protein